MLIQRMGAYRPGLTIWYPISFSNGRRNYMQIAASLHPHWLLNWPSKNYQIGYIKLYLFAFAFLIQHIYYGTFSFSNDLLSYLFTSHQDYT